jgi:hypothetical protein
MPEPSSKPASSTQLPAMSFTSPEKDLYIYIYEEFNSPEKGKRAELYY